METVSDLPLVGLATCYYEFSKENPGAGVRRQSGALRRLLAAELLVARCEFDKLKGFYDTLDRRDSFYLPGTMNSIIGALGRGDQRLSRGFSAILRVIRR